MSYKTILVHVDDSVHAAARIEVAASIAIAQDAHLIGAALTGISRFIEEAVAVTPYNPAITPYVESLRQRAVARLDRFDAQASGLGVHSYERRLIDDDADGGIGLQARYSDLVVVGQNDPAEPTRGMDADLPEYVAVSSGTPVLIIPYADEAPTVSMHALIAWNGSREARRAVHDAMPLLQAALRVEVVVFNPDEHADLHGGDARTDIIAFLKHHGIDAKLTTDHVRHGELGAALLALAAASSADLLVMGCYGHTRFREFLLGGMSRDVLAGMRTPVFMSH